MGLCSKTSKQLYCEWVFSPYTFVANKPAVQAPWFNTTTKGKTLGRNILCKGYVAKTYIQNLVKHRWSIWSWKNAEEARRKRQQTSMFHDFFVIHNAFDGYSLSTSWGSQHGISLQSENARSFWEQSLFHKDRSPVPSTPANMHKVLNVLHQLTLSTAMTNELKIYFVVCDPAPQKVVKLWHKPLRSFRLRT